MPPWSGAPPAASGAPITPRPCTPWNRPAHELGQAPDGDPGAGLAYFYDQGQYLATRTWCLLELGDPQLALATAGQSLAAADPAFVRNVALTRLAQARAYAQMGEPGKACEQIADAADLACQNNSPRLIRVLAQARQQLSPWATTPDVAGLDERLRVLRDHRLTGIVSSTRMSNTGAGTGGSISLTDTLRQPHRR